MMQLIPEVCKAFSQAAEQYESSAIIQQEIGKRMLDRLTFLTMNPSLVMDLGSGTGRFHQPLQQRFPHATLLGVDVSFAMLKQAQLKTENTPLIQGNMMHLPLASNSIDLVFSNQVIHWSTNRRLLFREIHRILKPGGCLFFSTLGPDTFKQLKQAWAISDTYEHVSPFSDMHLLGDDLLSERFLDPVMDREDVELQYASLTELIRSLKSQGVRNIHPNRNPGLTGKAAWQVFESSYQKKWLTDQGKAPLHYEVIYGHAWKGTQQPKTTPNEIRIPIRRKNINHS